MAPGFKEQASVARTQVQRKFLGQCMGTVILGVHRMYLMGGVKVTLQMPLNATWGLPVKNYHLLLINFRSVIIRHHHSSGPYL
jgi:hypothetical protein